MAVVRAADAGPGGPVRTGRAPLAGSVRPERLVFFGIGRPIRSSVGSVPMVIRPGPRRTGMLPDASSVASKESTGRSSAKAAAAGTSCSPVGAGSSLHTGALLENDDHTSRSSVGSRVGSTAAWLSVDGISPVGGAVQCGSGPVSAVPNDNASLGSISVVRSSPNNGGPKSSSSSRRPRRHRSSLMETPLFLVPLEVRPRAAPVPCGPTPCRSVRHGRG